MQVFRGAVIPSVTSRSRGPPALPRAGEHLFFFGSTLCIACWTDHGTRWETAAGLRPLSRSGSWRWATTLLIMVLVLGTMTCGSGCYSPFMSMYTLPDDRHFRRRLPKVKYS